MRIVGRHYWFPCALLFSLPGLLSPAKAQESPFIYGIHDHDTNIQEYLDHFSAGGVTGWVTATIAIGSNPNDTGGDDFRWIANQGHTLIVRLNNGYCGTGNVPTPDKYDDFARRAANYVAATQGANIFIIGNETNLAVEWPAVNGHARYVSPLDYASLFRKTYNAIKAVRPGAKVITQALAPFAGPFNAGSTCGFTHDPNPLNWVQYLHEMLTEIKSTGGIDGIALHINSRGYSYDDIHSTQKVIAGGQSLFFSFYVYRDWVDHGIPADLYHLPLYATESNGIFYWSGGHPENPGSRYERGWMQEIYAEIDRYNRQAVVLGKPVYRAVNMYRWCAWCDGWNIDNSPHKGQILADLDQAIAAQYRWPDGGSVPPPPPEPPPPEPVPDGDNLATGSVDWSASSVFDSGFGGDRAYDGAIAPDSKWTSDGTSAESWLALDLGGEFDVSGFIVRHAGAAGEPATYNTEAFRLESGGSLSGPWTSLATIDNASQKNSSTTVLANPEATRFVRLYISDAGIDDYARIPEFEVYGTAAPPPPPPPVTPPGDNVAPGAASWSASSSFSGDYGGDQAVDGVISASSKWTSDGSGAQSWLAVDLGGDHDVSGFIVRHAGAAGEPVFYNTEAYRLESGDSLSGPWTALASVDNATQESSTTTVLGTAVKTRYVRLYISDAGIDNYARIPEFEVYGTPAAPPPSADNLIVNGNFATGLNGWTVWNQRGNVNATVNSGVLQLGSSDHNGGIYQQFDTGGAGTTVTISGFWESNPTKPNYQWAEVLIIDGSRLPLNGDDVSESDADVVVVYKNDTWTSPGGWSGSMQQTAPVINAVSFVASGDAATVVLKSGNAGGSDSGTRYDDIVVEADGSVPPPPPPPPESVNRIENGDFGNGLQAWTVWTQRGNVDATVNNAALHLGSSDHNGGVYQQFDTGGSGTTVMVSGFWESNPTTSNNQWAELLVINGSRLPVNGEDVNESDSDVVLLYKNDTWAVPGGWSGSLDQTAQVVNLGSFAAAGDVATIVLKSGNAGGNNTGTTYDDIFVEADAMSPPPPTNGLPTATAIANPAMGTAPLSVVFDGTGSIDPDGDALSFSWHFGDGSSAAGATAPHTYTAAGTYVATLTVDDGNGGSDADSVTVTVSTPPPGGGQQWIVLETRSCSGPCDFNRIRADLNAQGQDLGFVKIGLHVGLAGNQTGLGVWEQTLHANGVPFFLKTVDSAGQVFEAVQLKAASGCIDNSNDGGSTSCVPHQLVFRRSVTGQNYTPDVPYTGSPKCSDPPPADIPYQQIYNETPYDAALAHWQRHRDEFPPELLPYKHLIWFETVNEINRGGNCDFDGDGIGGETFPHNAGLIDPVFGQYTKEGEWIAEFAIHTANFAIAEGFNWAAFGWSSGEPEIGTWAGPKMREFLALVAANPHRVAIATHEYSYTTDGLELAYPSLLGRFQEVFDVADHYGIGRPTVLITEFGWTLNDIPDVGQSMNVDLPWAAELYAPHHEIQGAAIWYLGGGWGNIANEAQRLIAPLTDYATRNYFVLGPAAPP